MEKTLVSWSSGKDSAWMLRTLQKRSDIQLVGLITTLNKVHDRVSIHGTRRSLLEAQAASIGLPLWPVMLPDPCSNKEYLQAFEAVIPKILADGITHVAFGDLFLDDVREYRVKQLKGTGIQPLFPLWGQNTRKLAELMISNGLRALIVSVDPKKLPTSFVGREYDTNFLRDLPNNIDPCGENGEFHTCVYDGPMFSQPLLVNFCETVERGGFFYGDLQERGSFNPDC